MEQEQLSLGEGLWAQMNREVAVYTYSGSRFTLTELKKVISSMFYPQKVYYLCPKKKVKEKLVSGE